MEKIHQRVSRFEDFMTRLLSKPRFTKKLSVTTLPAIVAEECTDMVLIKIASIKDYGAYANGLLNIYLYAKATDNESTKPIKQLDKMEAALERAISGARDPHYVLDYRDRSGATYDANRNYYCNIISFNVIIK